MRIGATEREKKSRIGWVNFTHWKSWLRIIFHSIDIHILFLMSSLFSKIIKYILYNTEEKNKDVYFFMSQDEFYLGYEKKVKRKKEQLLFSQWKKKKWSFCSWIFRGLQIQRKNISCLKEKSFNDLGLQCTKITKKERRPSLSNSHFQVPHKGTEISNQMKPYLNDILGNWLFFFPFQ